MSRATIVLEDNPQGTVNQTVSYEMDGKGAFDNNSQAHQYSRVMLGLASDFAKSNMELAKSNMQTSKEGSGLILLA